MSIDRVNISNQGIDRSSATQQATELARNSSSKNRQVPEGSDSVALSSKAAELNKLSGTVEQSRTEHLAQVRAQLESGTYQVSAKDLARKLIDSNSK
jgi:negative regulator of flagellin synthesis FlgM